MKETIIYSSKINSTELLRSLSLFGNNVVNCRVLDMHSLMDDANIRLGFPVKNKVLSNNEIEKLVISFFLDKIHLKCPSYQDVQHFISTLSNVRKFITNRNEIDAIKEVSINHQNNSSLQLFNTFIDSYFEALGNNLDSIGFARKVIAQVGSNKIYEEINYFEEDDISPFELYVLNSIANKVNIVKVIDLFKNELKKSNLSSINPRYGIRNEVAHVLKDIIDNKYPLDQCQIVLLNKTGYVNELLKFSVNLGLNMTFECGLPINVSDAFKLYKTITNVKDKNFFDVNGYINLFKCESLDLEKLGVNKDQIILVSQILGRLKVSFDKSNNDDCLMALNSLINNHEKEFTLFLSKIDRELNNNREEIIPQVFHVIEELSKGESYFIREYTKMTLNDEKLYRAAIDFICKTLDEVNSNQIPEELKNSYLSIVDSKYLCSKVFNDEALHVTTVSKALSNYRKHIYIIGMNSSNYPGGLTEDFLFSDNCYEELCGISEITEKSLTIKNEYLKKVIDTYLALGIDLKLSYSCQDIVGVRELNPCSVLLDYAEEYFDKPEDRLKELKSKCSYYDDGMSSLEDVVDIAVNNNLIKEARPKLNGEDIAQDYLHNFYLGKDIDLEAKAFSPSSLPSFMKCPLKFYLDFIAHIDNTIDYDPLRPIGGNRFGDLFHYVMEVFVKEMKDASLDEILEYASKLYDLYTSFDRSISDDNLEKQPFLTSVENTYHYLKSNYVLDASKTELGFGYEDRKVRINGIMFRGSIDLVTQDKEGNIVIVDFKTGNKIDHKDNDVESCIQGLIYSHGYAQTKGTKPIRMVFYYTRYNKEIVFDNPCGELNTKALNEKVELFKNALVNKEFDLVTPEAVIDGVCRYCKYGRICKVADRNVEEEEEE